MHPIHLHELARDHQAELLAEAARERLARSGRVDEPPLGSRLAGRLRLLIDHGLARIGRARQASVPPHSA